LIWFVDIGRLLSHYLSLSAGEWDPLVERACRLRLEKPLYFVSAYLREVFRPAILREHPPFPPPPLNRMERKLHLLLLKNRRIEGMGDLLYLLSIGRPVAQGRFLTQVLFPSQRVMREITGSFSVLKLSLGYLIRLGRLLTIGLRFLVRLFVGLTASRGS
jgi:hypothetical protein